MTKGVGETFEALQRIAQDGSDLTRPLEMDFFVAVPDRRSGEGVAIRASARGFRTSVEQDSESKDWTCYCTKTLVPELDAVLAIECELHALASEFKGRTDGFGTYGNAPHAAQGVVDPMGES